MATFTFDEGGAFKSVFGPLQDNQVDIVDNGVTFRFVPVNPALSGSISGDPADGAVPNLTLTATQANTSFTMTVPASNGADSLFGGAGRDVVLGGRGNDFLDPGADAVADQLNFNLNGGVDRVVNFTGGLDFLEVRGIASTAEMVFSSLDADTDGNVDDARIVFGPGGRTTTIDFIDVDATALQTTGIFSFS